MSWQRPHRPVVTTSAIQNLCQRIYVTLPSQSCVRETTAMPEAMKKTVQPTEGPQPLQDAIGAENSSPASVSHKILPSAFVGLCPRRTPIFSHELLPYTTIRSSAHTRSYLHHSHSVPNFSLVCQTSILSCSRVAFSSVQLDAELHVLEVRGLVELVHLYLEFPDFYGPSKRPKLLVLFGQRNAIKNAPDKVDSTYICESPQ